MGQEASLPANQGDSLEEQARAPPSTSNGGDGVGRGGMGPAGGSGRSSRKIMNAMFRHGHQNAAGGANIYDEDYGNGGYDQQQAYYAAQQQQQQQLQQEYGSNAGGQQVYSEQQQVPTAILQESQSRQQPVVGVLYENKSSSKKSIFSTKSTRGMINSMRNLSIGNALRKQKEATDWEKQWDEDDEDDDDDESDDAEHEQSAPGGQQQAYGMSSGTGPSQKPAAVSPQRQTPQQARPGMDYGHSRMTPVSHGGIPPSTLEAQQLASPSTAIPSGSNLPKPVSAEAQSYAAQEPVDLLSGPMADTHIQSPPHHHQQQQHQYPENGLDWDNAVPQPPSVESDGSKPDVQMFMPMLRVLGKGSFGKVVLVQKREGKERGQLFAMKILRKTHLVKRRQIERTRTERKVLSVVNHPFIMKLHYAFQTDDKLYLVLDYCPGGELFFHLSRFRRFPERVARFYAAELLLAIGHLHKRGIIYRDLKPENVLLDAEGHVKLGDFGLAKTGITHPLTGAQSMCGTPEYMAPEVLAQAGHGFCVDYWGLGMIVYEMMTGLPPWYTTDRAQLFRRLKSAPLDIPSYFSVASANCVSALLERNPRRRLGITGIRTAMEHEFFRNISWRSLYSRRVEAPVRPCEGWKPPEPVQDGDPALQPTNNYSGSGNQGGIEHLGATELDTATQNFDNQFTRMPVESEDAHTGDAGGEGSNHEELTDETFLGFSFDIVKHREAEAASASASASKIVPGQEQQQQGRPHGANFPPAT